MNNSIGILDINQATAKGPLSPFLTAFAMAGGIESACLAGKHQESLFPTVRAPHACKSAHRITAVEILLDHILNHRTEISVLLLETILIFSKELLNIIIENRIKNGIFRMTLTVDPGHSREDDS
jgi:hypothetical protein